MIITKKLTPKQQRFCDEFLLDLNYTQAAIRAGYSPLSAGKVSANPAVRARVDEALAERSRRTGVNADRVVRELAKCAFVNPNDVIDFSNATLKNNAAGDDTAAIASVKIKMMTTSAGEGVEREIRLTDKLRALELLGRHLGMFSDNIRITGEAVQIIDDIPHGEKT